MDSISKIGKAQLDLLRKLPRSPQNDTLKLKTLNFLGSVYRIWFGRKDTLLIYSNELISLSKELNIKSFMLDGYSLNEYYYRIVKSNFPEAIKINNLALKYCNNDKESQPYLQRFKGNLANLYYEIGDFDNSLKLFFETLPLIANNPDEISKGKQYAGVFQGIAGCYRKQNKLQLSEEYLIKAIDSSIKYDTGSSMAWLLGDLGFVYKEMGKYSEAILYYKKAESIWQKLNIYQAVGGIWSDIAQVFLLQKNYDEAIEYALKSIGKNTRVPITDEMSYSVLYKSYKEKKEWDKALNALEKYHQLQDAGQKQRKEKDALILQAQYEKERIEAENNKQLQYQQQRFLTLENQAKIDKLQTENEKKLLAQKAKNSELLRLSEIERLKTQSSQLQSKQEIIIRNLKINELNQTLINKNRVSKFLISITLLSLFLGISSILFFRNQSKQKRLILEKEAELREKESGFQQKIAETEITALRSQMNPHFIFNCLNSIKLYSLENDSQSASDYLTKFSRLIRLVLENSRSEKVTLENELETLKLYIEMEAMRFKDKVKYQINIAPNIDQQFIEIPPLLIQPFVENSIWHGLMHKSEGGTVKIDVSQPKEQVLHIEISDDGIGREKAQAYKSKSAMKQKSFGMKVTSERIELINQIYKTNTEVEIIDLKDQNGEALGTKVLLNIPI